MLSVKSIARVVVNVIRSLGSVTAFDTGLLLFKDVNYADSRRLKLCEGYDEAIAQMTTWGFASTSEAYKSVRKYFNSNPAPSQVYLSCYPTAETLDQALDAVLDITSSFYGVGLGQAEVDARITTLAEHIESLDVPLMLFVPITGTVTSVVAAASLLSTLHEAGYQRTFPFYCEAVSDACGVLGTAMGLSLSHQDTAFSMCYKEIASIQPSVLTESEIASLKEKGCNVYITRGYTHNLLEQGQVVNCARYDEILYIDMISSELQNAAVSMLAENPDKMPQTDDSTAVFMNAFSSILMKYTDMNVLASSKWRANDIGPIKKGDVIENGFMMWADTYDNQSDADRAAHKAVPVQVALTMSGSIESIVITVNVTV